MLNLCRMCVADSVYVWVDAGKKILEGAASAFIVPSVWK